MSDTAAGLLTVLALVVVLGVTHVPLGDYMAKVYSTTKHWRAERVLYRLCRIDPDADQSWPTYALSVLGFSLASVLFLFGLQRLQHVLPLSARLRPGRAASRLEHGGVVRHQHQLAELRRRERRWATSSQMAGLAVQNFTSAAVGHGRGGRARPRLCSVSHQPGRQLLGRPGPGLRPHPVAAGRASSTVLLIAGGVVQNLSDTHTVSTIDGRHAAPAGWRDRQPGGHQGARARTAGAPTTPTRPIPSRTPTRSPTSSRS